MKITVSLKELLVILDIILFAHVRFHKSEYNALLGTDEESRNELREKITNYIIDVLSDNKETKEIELTETDLTNLIGYSNHFEIYKNYEMRKRFRGDDIENLKSKLEMLEKHKN